MDEQQLATLFKNPDRIGKALVGLDFRPYESFLKRPSSKVPLRMVDFSGCNFSGLSLRSWTFTRSNFNGAVLDGADLTSVNLSEASFKNASLIGTCLQATVLLGSDWTGATLDNADFRNALYDYGDFQKAKSSSNILVGRVASAFGDFIRDEPPVTSEEDPPSSKPLEELLATHNTANLLFKLIVRYQGRPEKLYPLLKAAHLNDLVVQGADLGGLDLYGADFTGSQFNQVNCAGTVFKDACLKGVVFRGCRMTGADFTGSDLSGTSFPGSVLRKVTLGPAVVNSEEEVKALVKG